jgi:hypothetical protein
LEYFGDALSFCWVKVVDLEVSGMLNMVTVEWNPFDKDYGCEMLLLLLLSGIITEADRFV